MDDGLSGQALAGAAEAVVVALAIGGDTKAFTELVRRRQSWLRNLLRRLCRDRALADDLAQQAFLDAWRALRTLRSVNAFGAWLRQIAVNVWRRQARDRESFVPLESEVAEAGETPATAEQVDLDRTLGRLSPDERLCIVLAYGEGMTHGEISRLSRLPLGTVKSHLYRGIQHLRQQFESEVESSHVR